MLCNCCCRNTIERFARLLVAGHGRAAAELSSRRQSPAAVIPRPPRTTGVCVSHQRTEATIPRLTQVVCAVSDVQCEKKLFEIVDSGNIIAFIKDINFYNSYFINFYNSYFILAK